MTVRNTVALVVAGLVLSSACFPQAKSATEEETVFRAPFKLKIHVDDDHYYEQSFDRIPYVADNDVYLFAGEAFGVDVIVTGRKIRTKVNAGSGAGFLEDRISTCTSQGTNSRWQL